MRPKAIIIRAAGTNCERETAAAAEKGGFTAEIVHVNRLAAQPGILDYGLLVVPGGFSYGDDLGAGTVFGNELAVRLGDALRDFIRKGSLVLGICNGFQILVRTGLLPDPFGPAGPAPLTVTANAGGKFEDRWVHLKVSSLKSDFLVGEEVIELPVAHGEGNVLPRNDEVLSRLRSGGQVVLRYVGPDGKPAGYPWNPNGSVDDIAGICDPTGRVLGLMPHPERYQDPTNHPKWTRLGRGREPDGLKFFRNAAAHLGGKVR